MTADTHRDIARILDENSLGSFRLAAMVVCFAVVALDGFDTQSIAFVAPALRERWQIPPELFGPLFGAGLFGTLVGSIALGSLADRFGRKPLVLFSTLLFGVMTVTCATATSVPQLALYRFVAGLGLGGALPNVLALISEYSPKRIRATAVVVTFAGFPIGAVVGGMVSARLIPTHGWESVFLAGGVLPLLLLPAIGLWVPESARYLALRPGGKQRLYRILGRIEPQMDPADLAGVELPRGAPVRIPVRQLFTGGRSAWTLLLWLLTFTTLLLGYFLVNWTPLLLTDAGLAHGQAIMGVVVLNLGGILGSIIIGRISDRRGPFAVLTFAFLVGALMVAAVGLAINSSATVLLSLIFLVGFCVFGAQLNLSAVSANYYPVYMRSTGIGWGMGMGRFGSVVGPTVGGALVAWGLSRGQMFLCAALPAVVASATVIAMSYKVPVEVENEEAAKEPPAREQA